MYSAKSFLLIVCLLLTGCQSTKPLATPEEKAYGDWIKKYKYVPLLDRVEYDNFTTWGMQENLNEPCDCGIDFSGPIMVVVKNGRAREGYNFIQSLGLTFSNEYSEPFNGRVLVHNRSFADAKRIAMQLKHSGLFKAVGWACEACDPAWREEYSYEKMFKNERDNELRHRLCEKILKDGINICSTAKAFGTCRFSQVLPITNSPYGFKFNVVGHSSGLILQRRNTWESLSIDIRFFDNEPWSTEDIAKHKVGVSIEIKKLYVVKSPPAVEPTQMRFEMDSDSRLENKVSSESIQLFAQNFLRNLIPPTTYGLETQTQ